MTLARPEVAAHAPPLYAPDAEVARLEAQWAAATGAARQETAVTLAWYLRQRDTRRAEALARGAAESGDRTEARACRRRLVLVECELLLGHIDQAQAAALDARAHAERAGEASSLIDLELLCARIAEVRGDHERELAHYAEAQRHTQTAGDAERAGHARVAALMASGMGEPVSFTAALEAVRAHTPQPSRALEAHLRLVEAMAAFQRGAFAEAVPLLSAVRPEALACGMIEQAMRAEMGLVGAYSNLGDRESSCTIAESALAHARDLGWPRAVGHALANLARQLADTGQPSRAVELLEEARGVLADQPRSRAYAIATYYLGDALLSLKQHEAALEHLTTAEHLMSDLGAQPEVACLRAIRARALSRLGRPVPALASAQAGLDLARQTKSRLWQVEALRSLAEIHASHRVDPPPGARPEEAPLGYLLEALTVVESIGGHHAKSDLYAEIARAHEAVGDVVHALEAERVARAEQVKEANRRAANLVLLAQVRYDTERERVEAQYQRSLAAAESDRARTLEATLETLDHLRRVGQDITSHLEASVMLEALDRHLGRLADVSFIAVFVLDAADGKLRRYSIERGRVLPERDVPLADFESYAARVARDRKELYVETEEGGRPATRIPGTQATCSLWFGPLIAKEELLGVLTVQTPTVRAYGDREKLIFRTVSGHAAVALANARTHGELAEKHRRLAETEAEMRRLATTDSLTGLANRRRFLSAAESEFARLRRYGGALGLVMADLDRFKSINDAAGHGAGDRVIAAVAAVLRAQQRPNDIVGRMGGEEFALLLPGAGLESTRNVAERIRAAVEALAIDWEGTPLRITMSLGAASTEGAPLLAEDAAALERLLREADTALYEAKRRGRNLTVAAERMAPGNRPTGEGV